MRLPGIIDSHAIACGITQFAQIRSNTFTVSAYLFPGRDVNEAVIKKASSYMANADAVHSSISDLQAWTRPLPKLSTCISQLFARKRCNETPNQLIKLVQATFSYAAQSRSSPFHHLSSAKRGRPTKEPFHRDQHDRANAGNRISHVS